LKYDFAELEPFKSLRLRGRCHALSIIWPVIKG